jgi:hypothetical protein
MRLRTTAILAALVIASSLAAPTALAQSVCGSHKTVADALAKRYAETPISMGVTIGGAVVEIYASPEGTWTLLITQPNGVTCLIAAGKDWENLPRLAKGGAI